MKKVLVLILLLCAVFTGAWAETYFKSGTPISSAEELTAGKYFINIVSRGYSGLLNPNTLYLDADKTAADYYTVDEAMTWTVVKTENGFNLANSEGACLSVYARGSSLVNHDVEFMGRHSTALLGSSTDEAANFHLDGSISYEGITHFYVNQDKHLLGDYAKGISYLWTNMNGGNMSESNPIRLSFWENKPADYTTLNTGAGAVLAFYPAEEVEAYTITSNFTNGGVVFKGKSYTDLLVEKEVLLSDLTAIDVAGDLGTPVITIDEENKNINVHYLFTQMLTTTFAAGKYYRIMSNYSLREGYYLRSNKQAEANGTIDETEYFWGNSSNSQDRGSDLRSDVDDMKYENGSSAVTLYHQDGGTTNNNVRITKYPERYSMETLWQFISTGTANQYYLYNPQSERYIGEYSQCYQLRESGGSCKIGFERISDTDCFQIRNYLYQTANSSQGYIMFNHIAYSPLNWGPEANTTSGNSFKIYEVNALPLTVSSVGYTTVCYPVPVTIPSDVEAYIVNEINGQYINLEQVEGNVAAKTPLIVKASAGTYYFAIATSGTEYSDNILVGTTVRRVGFGEHSFYALVKDDEAKDGVSFKWNASTVTACPANKAYIPVSSMAAAPAYYFNFDDGMTTGIESASLSHKADVLYNLQGQPVSQPTRGIYVKANGQKVMILK